MKRKNRKPHILINIGTHGDETIGFSVVKKLRKIILKRGVLDINIANEKAVKLKKRYIDQDLNRSFPGKLSGNHEERLARKILPKIQSADIVLDVHSTTSALRDAVIVTKLNKKTKEYIRAIAPRYLLYMSVTKNNALMSAAKIGIAFEYGPDKDTKTILKTARSIFRLLSFLKMTEIEYKVSGNKTLFFDVYSTISKPKGARLLKSVKNYKQIKTGQVYAKTKEGNNIEASKDFYPILFGEKNYKDIFGFAGKRINT